MKLLDYRFFVFFRYIWVNSVLILWRRHRMEGCSRSWL